MSDPTPRYQLDPGDVPRSLVKLDLIAFGAFSIAIDRCDRATRKLAYYGGTLRDGYGGVLVVEDGDLTCPDDQDSYIVLDPISGAITAENELDENKIALHIATCVSGDLTHVEDIRDVNFTLRVPPGGDAAQVLTKLDATDFNFTWVDPPALGYVGVLNNPMAGAEMLFEADAVYPGLNDGDPVDQWNDLSGNGKHLLASGSARPIYKANDGDGVPYVHFDGSDDAMGTGLLTAYTGKPLTLFLVARIWTSVGNSRMISLGKAGVNAGETADTMGIEQNSGGTQIIMRRDSLNVGPGAVPITLALPGVSAWGLYAVRFFTANSLTYSTLHFLEVVGGTYSWADFGYTELGIGARLTGTSTFDRFCAVDIRAAAVYHSALGSDREMKRMMQYFTNKYSVMGAL